MSIEMIDSLTNLLSLSPIYGKIYVFFPIMNYELLALFLVNRECPKSPRELTSIASFKNVISKSLIESVDDLLPLTKSDIYLGVGCTKLIICFL